MNKYVGFGIFLSMFLTVSLGMHYYVMNRLSLYFGIEKDAALIFFWIFLSASFIIATFIQNYRYNHFTKGLYIGAAIWLGTIVIMFFGSLIIGLFHALFGFEQDYKSGILLIAFTSIMIFYGLLNAFFIRVKSINIPIGKNIKIVQLSDIHIGAVHDKRFLEKVVEKTNLLDPDIVFITGDLVDGTGKLEPKTFAPLKKLKAKTFFVAGNHEMYEGIDIVTKNIENTGLIFLRNKVIEYKGIQIIGVDYDPDVDYLIKVLPRLEIDKNKPSILLYHTPTELKTAAEFGINLQLSGHTHNGQMFPFDIITKIFYPHSKGLYKYKNTRLFVSQGTGTWGPPMRIFTNSEIVEIRLKA